MPVEEPPAMARLLTCPAGHQWSPAVDPSAPALGGSICCPVCGTVVDSAVPAAPTAFVAGAPNIIPLATQANQRVPSQAADLTAPLAVTQSMGVAVPAASPPALIPG